ncbi:replication protein A, partial [Salmonella enterica subsp. enterica serovar 1,4,[5],12:i:-]|nr:replication protein A [Salmonella enterica subsp. enterica serovar 1,4,[5],12:i:-]
FVRFGVSKQNYAEIDDDRWYQRHDGGVLLPVELLDAKQEGADRTRGKGHAAAAY